MYVYVCSADVSKQVKFLLCIYIIVCSKHDEIKRLLQHIKI